MNVFHPLPPSVYLQWRGDRHSSVRWFVTIGYMMSLNEEKKKSQWLLSSQPLRDSKVDRHVKQIPGYYLNPWILPTSKFSMTDDRAFKNIPGLSVRLKIIPKTCKNFENSRSDEVQFELKLNWSWRDEIRLLCTRNRIKRLTNFVHSSVFIQGVVGWSGFGSALWSYKCIFFFARITVMGLTYKSIFVQALAELQGLQQKIV